MADNKEQQYREMFYAEAHSFHDELDTHFTELEKDPQNSSTIDSIFRITHTLKGNALGMGFEEIAELSHLLEDVFSGIKEGRITLDQKLFQSLFKANDKLGALIEALNTGEEVSYKGIRTKLQVLLKEVEGGEEGSDEGEGQEGLQEAPDAGEEASETPEQEEGNEKEASESEENGGEEETDAPEGAVSQQAGEAEGEEDDDEDDESSASTSLTISDQVQVPVRKLDELLNLVGELIIEKDGLIANSVNNGHAGSDLSRLHRIASDLQYGIMDVRLIQVGVLFNKFHRVVRDAGKAEGKEVELELAGTEIEVDRNILKIISDSLLHLVRNSVSHGLETPDERERTGKYRKGTIRLEARNEKDNVIIEVSDDGKGLDTGRIREKVVEKGFLPKEAVERLSDEDVHMYIFEPGFSSSSEVSEVSGRGVGMDVVKNTTESIGGKVHVTTEQGKGSSIKLSLPSSMAVKGALLFEEGEQEYAIPLSYTESVVSWSKEELHSFGGTLMAKHLNNTISVVYLKDLLEGKAYSSQTPDGKESSANGEEDGSAEAVVVSYNDHQVGIVVDRFSRQKEIVEKNLPKPVDHIDIISGATILGNGNVCLVLDVPSIIRDLFRERAKRTA
jgi:two-component system chemotaxis sensor kinase CheA